LQIDYPQPRNRLSLFHNRYFRYAESLGPSVIKSYLESLFGDSIEVDIIDMQFGASVDEVLERLAADPPEIVGLSVRHDIRRTITPTLAGQRQRNRQARRRTTYGNHTQPPG